MGASEPTCKEHPHESFVRDQLHSHYITSEL